MSVSASKKRRALISGLAFLTPNIICVGLFTIFPVFFSIGMAFTNWDLTQHNMFKDVPLRFVGFDNFVELFRNLYFWQYLGNTLFLMIGIPFAMAGSLGAALLLNQNARSILRRGGLLLLATVGLTGACLLLVTLGMAASATVILVVSVAVAVLMTGTVGGSMVYRTLFYMPHFTAGVATFLLWKKMYDPLTGPINQALNPVLSGLEPMVLAAPDRTFSWLAIALVLVIGWLAMSWIGKMRGECADGDLGPAAFVLCVLLLLAPLLFLGFRAMPRYLWFPLSVGAVLITLFHAGRFLWSERMRARGPWEGAGGALLLTGGLLTLSLILFGLSLVSHPLPAMAAEGLDPPRWLVAYHWAKPALMIMAFWGAIGSNNMLLYLAALSNVPQDLMEAADIDGAGAIQKFWYVTWPQLAPTTFFILTMSVIIGLQGGFEMARAMTEGGPAGATTTLSYYIYSEGFETGRLGYASAVAWIMFIMVFSITIVNWKFGSRYVND